jgi:hypothetical protein
MVVTHHDDSDVIRINLEEKVIGKPFQIAAAISAWIEMMNLWQLSSVADCIDQFRPELVRQFGEMSW